MRVMGTYAVQPNFTSTINTCSRFRSLNLPPGASGRGGTLYVGSLHFSLTESEIQQVFEPFGELEFVDLHKDSATGRSKGYAFVQYAPSFLATAFPN